MNTSTIIFSIIIIILIIIISILFYKLNIVNTDINNIITTLNNHILSDINPNVSKEISDIKQLTLDKLKVKDIEVENNLSSPNIKTDNLSAIKDKININNDLNINNNIRVNKQSLLTVQIHNKNEPNLTLDSNDGTYYFKDISADFDMSSKFEDIIINNINNMNHINNDELHNGKSSDKIMKIIKKDEETEDKIENFTDLFYY